LVTGAETSRFCPFGLLVFSWAIYPSKRLFPKLFLNLFPSLFSVFFSVVVVVTTFFVTLLLRRWFGLSGPIVPCHVCRKGYKMFVPTWE
tara:strand:- start:15822 stop:16088 length:267 start_codon:yes stop_codon:yes gene_type:complete